MAIEILSVFVLDGHGDTLMSAHKTFLWGLSSLKNKHQDIITDRTTQIMLSHAEIKKTTHVRKGKEHFYLKKSTHNDTRLLFISKELIKSQGAINLLFTKMAAAEEAGDLQQLKAIIKDPEKKIEKPSHTQRLFPRYSGKNSMLLSPSKLPPRNRESKP